MFRCILVAIDGSTHADRALDEPIDLAQVSGARLSVMTVIPEPSTWILGAGYGVPVDNELSDQVEREYTAMLRATGERVPGDVSVSSVVKRGSAGPAILEQIEDGDHDLGSWAHGDAANSSRSWLGSVSHRVLQASPVPILVVHARENALED